MTVTQGRTPAKRPAFEPAAGLLEPTHYDPQMARPAATIAGALLVLLRTLAGAFVLAGIVAGWDGLLTTVDSAVEVLAPDPDERAAGGVVIALGSAALLFQTVLAILIFRGHNWPRVLVMLIAVFDICTTFYGWSVLDQEMALGSLASLALDILVLLALSSRSAAAYARRNERRPQTT